jgi:hypothetical protein
MAIVLEGAAVVASMNEIPSAVATATRGRSTISTPANRPSAIAPSIAVRVSTLPGTPSTTDASALASFRRAA